MDRGRGWHGLVSCVSEDVRPEGRRIVKREMAIRKRWCVSVHVGFSLKLLEVLYTVNCCQ